MAVVRARPFDYLGSVAADYLRFFEPGAMSIVESDDEPITFPEEPRPPGGGAVRRRYIPDYEADVHPPAAALSAYQRVIHTPRWLLAAFAVLGVAVVLLGLVPSRRDRLPRRKEVFLLVGGGLMLLLPAALSHFELRYLLPSVPLLVSGGVLATYDLVGLRARGADSARAEDGPHGPLAVGARADEP
jgi:hypothetical protein